MTLPTVAELISVVEATWPPAVRTSVGPWTIRDGRGGGKRVSAATAEQRPVRIADVREGEAAMEALGQDRLFMIRPGDESLDELLAGIGYEIIDPVDLYVAPIEPLVSLDVPRLSALPAWPPLAVQREVWALGGIGPDRIAVMERAVGPKTTLLGRWQDRPVGSAFVALQRRISMVHALEVLAKYRKHGVGRNLVSGAALWAAGQGAKHISLAVTSANVAARALYSSLGFTLAGHYHYRIRNC